MAGGNWVLDLSHPQVAICAVREEGPRGGGGKEVSPVDSGTSQGSQQ